MDKTTQLYELANYQPISRHNVKIQKKLASVDFLKELGDIPVIDPAAFIGIEVEVENVRVGKELARLVTPVWDIIPDGSLRNYGVEFVTLPMRASHAHKALILLETALKKYSKYEFTDRTSIHIHVNVRRLTLEQLFVMLITYLVTEKSLFQFINRCGVTRDTNIFCTPITESKYHLQLDRIFNAWDRKDYQEFFNCFRAHWKKYTAFNLLPLADRGTVEFRHMGGTIETPQLMIWLNLILCLRKFSYQHSLEQLLDRVDTLNSSSMYGAFLTDVFGRYSGHLAVRNYEKDLEEGITQVKDCLQWAKKTVNILAGTSEEFAKTSFSGYLKAHGYQLMEIKENENKLKLRALEEEHEKLLLHYDNATDDAVRKKFRNLLLKSKAMISDLRLKIAMEE